MCARAAQVSLALKAQKPVVLLAATPEAEKFFASLAPALVHVAADVDGAMSHVKSVLAA